MKPVSTSSKSFVIPSLDGLRAISILIVFLSHAGLHRFIPGLFGVTVFFFLSGYLITTLLRLECEQTGGVSLRDFYWRRVLRIFPPFYLVLGVIVLLMLAGLLRGTFTWPAVGAQALYLANYQEIFGHGGQPPGTEILWSLAVEEHFYLVFPLLYLVLRRWLPQPRHQFYALAGLAAVVLAWRFVLVYGLHAIPLDPRVSHHPRLCHATDTRLDSILFGCMLAIYGNPALDPTRFSRRFWVGAAVPLGIGAILFTFVHRDPGFRETLRYTVQGLALLPIFIAAIRFADNAAFRFLNWRWVRFLGVLSYSIYLTHATVIAAFAQWLQLPAGSTGLSRALHLLLQGLLAFMVSAVIATLIHYTVEKPCARLRKKLSRVRAPIPAISATSLTYMRVDPRPFPPRVSWGVGKEPSLDQFPSEFGVKSCSTPFEQGILEDPTTGTEQAL